MLPLFDRPTQNVFDGVTRLAGRLVDAPVALVTLVEGDRLLFASCVGPDLPWRTAAGIPLAHSACQYAIADATPVTIEDARRDDRTRESPAVGELGIVGYIGVPLVGTRGRVVGTICAITDAPRSWSNEDIAALQDLSALATAYLVAQPDLAPAAGMNIAAVAQRTGIGADTLRKWERRYGVLRPRRTAGGQRRYDDRDVARVEWLRDRLEEGFRIGEAAALLTGDSPGADSSVPGLRDAIVAASAETEPRRLAALVEHAFTLHGVETAVEQIVAPALRSIGSGDGGPECIAQEHLLSELVQARLRTLLDDQRHAVRGTAVLACAPGEQHELGLLALAVQLHADGWLVVYLGSDTPLAAALEAATRTDATLLCLSASSPERLAALDTALAEVTVPDGLAVVTGGAADGRIGLADAVAAVRDGGATPRG